MALPEQGEQIPGRMAVHNEDTGFAETLNVNMFRHGEGLMPGRASLLRALGIELFEGANGTEVPGLLFPCGLTVVPSLGDVYINQQLTSRLTRAEFAVFSTIAISGRAVTSRHTMLESMWGQAVPLDVNAHTVDVHLSHAKIKLGAQPGRGSFPEGPNTGLVATVRGQGFTMGRRAYQERPLVFPS